MISHINIGVSDFEQARPFYEALFEILGLELRFREDASSWGAWGQPSVQRPLVIISEPFDGGDQSAGNGQMIAFEAEHRKIVDKAHECALRQGGHSEGLPGFRPHYHEHYYGTYFRDPDGNKLCVCCHLPE